MCGRSRSLSNVVLHIRFQRINTKGCLRGSGFTSRDSDHGGRRYIVLRRMDSERAVRRLRKALSEVVDTEITKKRKLVNICFGSDYLRDLFDQYASSEMFYQLRGMASIAQSVLGPQINVDEATARLTNPTKREATQIRWLIHLRVVPNPLPRFFICPHAIECLLYLDDPGTTTAGRDVFPGSNLAPTQIHSVHDVSPKLANTILCLSTGDCVPIHSNPSHCAVPSVAKRGHRRLLTLATDHPGFSERIVTVWRRFRLFYEVCADAAPRPFGS